MNTYQKYENLKLELTKYRDLLSEYDGDIATKKVIAKMDKLLKEA